MIPRGSIDAPGIEGDDRPTSLSCKRGGDKSDDLLPQMQECSGSTALEGVAEVRRRSHDS